MTSPGPRVIVASHNPVKLAAVRGGFERMFPERNFVFEAIHASSGVADQPLSTAETLLGARNRAEGARRAMADADFWVGVEGGIEDSPEGMCAFAWVVVLSRERRGKGRTATFFLPDRIAELVRGGKELGEADDIVFGHTNSKQKNGAIGLLTHDVIDRTGLYEAGVVVALIPFQNPDLFAAELANP
jgi:inosine/xanthosine triphosphatase